MSEPEIRAPWGGTMWLLAIVLVIGAGPLVVPAALAFGFLYFMVRALEITFRR